ncbi:Glycosyltransferase family 28, N-terminal domain, partial [Dillenia turbinata]
DEMGSNGVANSVEDSEHKNGGVWDMEIKELREDSSSVEFLRVEGDQALDTQLDVGSSDGLEAHKKVNLHHKSVVEISRLKEFDGTASPRRGEFSNSLKFFESQELIFSRSKTEKKETPKHDLKLDRLSERERKKLIVNLVKIQNDGTVEVDIEKSAPVASELLELQSVEGTPRHLDDVINDFNRSVPRLKIAILVVGTRGDVQPFLAVAKRLQACKEFGHQVRLATHANFKTFVTSAGVDFYPLGGDPRVLAGCRPTYEFPHPLARVPQSAGYWLSYIVVDLLIWWGIRGYINDFRKKKLKLPPIAYFSTYHGSISHLPTGYMWSPHLVPKPKAIACQPLEDPKKTTDIILEALRSTGQRGIIDRGWGDLGSKYIL